ncbi:protein of unknown function [Georgfuchsia toluolica]|uniref:Uncharacterized protein n=1 Tax=Georgfuchsia toluolica TaxID=424218 RepID=A0A916NGQ0_9PROT|nr:protein of unknown function [Georgfuchsia toluolica]
MSEGGALVAGGTPCNVNDDNDVVAFYMKRIYSLRPEFLVFPQRGIEAPNFRNQPKEGTFVR